MRSRFSFLVASFLCLLSTTHITFPKRASVRKKTTTQKKQSKQSQISSQVKKSSKQSSTLKTSPPTLKASAFTVRVLLDEGAAKKTWHLSSKGGFTLWDPEQPKKKIKSRGDDIFVSVSNQKLYLDNKPFAHKKVYLKPQSSTVQLDGHSYHGDFLVEQNAKRTLLINCLDLEDYVCSVVRTESWPGWPLEVNKVFAIVSRGYAISMIMRANKNKQSYHVKNTNEHQTYSGVHTNETIAKAVKDTKGVFLAYKNEPILAMFDSCCGGIIPAHIADFDFGKAPYLARKYACTHCKRCSIYSWQAEFGFSELLRKVNQKFASFSQITDVKVHKKDKAGLVQEVVFKSKNNTEILSGKQMYSLLGPVKSFCFDVQKKANKFVLKGRGFGHHIGLCQWGAREMVRDGWNYRRILKFYYPGTDFKRLV